MQATSSVWRTLCASGVIGIAGMLVAHAATDGFEAYTLESARRLEALRAPQPVPRLALEWADGRSATLHAETAPVLLVDFIYTRCASYCAALGATFTKLQARLAEEIAAGQVRLVSISFDPGNDDASALAAYRARHHGDPAAWHVGRPADAAQLRTWLDAFGVVVIRDELGGWAHNAAIHVVGADRRLIAIHALAELDAIVASARASIPERHATVAR